MDEIGGKLLGIDEYAVRFTDVPAGITADEAIDTVPE
jgi:hypothetical protein